RLSPFSSTDSSPSEIPTLSLHDALPILGAVGIPPVGHQPPVRDHAVLPRHRGRELPGHLVVREVVGREPEVVVVVLALAPDLLRSEEHTSELQSRGHLVCRLLLEKKKNN